MKKLLTIALTWAITLYFLCVTAFAADTYTLIVNGINVDRTCFTQSGMIYVPVRCVMEALGCEVTWDGSTHEVVLQSDAHTVLLDVDENLAQKDGTQIAISDVILTDGTTYVPLAFLQKYCGLTSEIAEKTNRLYLYGEDPVSPFITAEYPIVIVPGTLGCWSSVDFESLKEHVKKDVGNSFADMALILLRPMLLTMLDGIQTLERSLESYYITETNGKIYYIEPFWDTYVPLCEYLQSNGLRQNEDYFIFGYDTLNVAIEDNAENLSKYVASVKEKTGAEKVQVIAHSQGGLITRQYIQNCGGYSSIAKFMGVGVPNEGVSYTYPLYERGSFNPLDGREMMLAVLAYFSYGDFSNAAKMRLLHENTKTIVQMLPMYIDMGELENRFLYHLNRESGLENLNRVGAENILFLAGSDSKTISGYDRSGKPTHSYAGDSTVLVSSAVLDGYPYGLLAETMHTELFRSGNGLYRYFDLRIE